MRIIKSDLDKFYTKTDLVKHLISLIPIKKYDLVIDPCCGDGAFYNLIDNNKIGIDILPHIDNVIQQDFLEWDYSVAIDKKVLVISNPPFGRQGSLAMKFINRCSKFADTIAFILPLSFAKPSVKNRVPKNYHLVYEENLKEDSFLLDGVDYDVKCVFQIWERREEERVLIESIKEEGFLYTKDPSIADISVRRVGVNAGKASLDLNKSKQSHYFLIFKNKDDIGYIIDHINNTKWYDLTLGPRSISKSELNLAINKKI